MSTNTATPPQPDAMQQRLNEATILMIDDEKLNSYVVAEYLKADGYRDLIHTTDPLNALALATVPAARCHTPRYRDAAAQRALSSLGQLRADAVLAENAG